MRSVATPNDPKPCDRGTARCSAWLGHGSFEWRDRQERELLPGAIPIVAQFLKMQRPPLVDEIVRVLGKMPLMDRSRLDLDQRLVLSINRVEVIRRMIAVIKPDHDPVKPADLRHGLFPPPPCR